MPSKLRPLFTGLVAGSVLLVAGCGTTTPVPHPGSPTSTPSGSPTSTPSGSPTSTPSGSPTATPSGSPTATPGSQSNLYVANGSAGNVLRFTSPFSASSTPAAILRVGRTVYGVAADSAFVAVEDDSGYVYIFDAPLTQDESPAASFQAGSSGSQLAFDASGDLFTGTQTSNVLEYTPPFSDNMTPNAVINGANTSFSIAVDFDGNLYSGGLGTTEIDAYAPPYTGAPVKATSPGTYGLASYETFLFGADATDSVIDAYDLPLTSTSSPAYTIPNADPHAVAFDSQGSLYVGDQHGGTGSGSIDVYVQPLSGSSISSYSITTDVVEPVQVAVSQ